MKIKRYQINLYTVFTRLFCSLLLIFVFGCNQNIENNKYNGKWILKQQNYTEKIILQNGNYTKDYSSDDIRVNSNGKFYLNRNENRLGITLSLIPNKIISEKDTIFQECENLDIIEINDSNLIIQKPNQWIRNVNDKFMRVNETLIYKKQ